MTITATATTAQRIQSHDFASVGNGYAVISAANQLTRSNSMAKLASLMEGLRERLRALERLQDLQLSDRLQQTRWALVDPVNGQVLGWQNMGPGGVPGLQADLALVGLVPQVDSWYRLGITQDASPSTSSTRFVSPEVIAYVRGLLADVAARDMGSSSGSRRYEFVGNDGGTPVRTVFALGESAIQTLSPAEVSRLQQGVQSVTAQRVEEVRQLAAKLTAAQQVATQAWSHGKDIDAYQQERIRRCQQGLSSTP